ncbi:peptidoglycan/LPS O-acetylase OafA/YrhL [Antricoccus suffuscus]|uniref:Peptidoglycan/LPS O-acetylase OafA/YrhL n=2 Tax=Antricoccus suffuscus TaxID=1629062 RepID=A0A2T1A7Q2_9ACTN|nr:peptidoglycan/LPS O-acetylase OafA/YrhL [Antricoccus suffuscus]
MVKRSSTVSGADALTTHNKRARKDIQALRAVAVVAVVLYHLWPSRLTGGFVGVDVFFVVSGFLITSHLVAKPPARIVDLATFWGRRIRRLLAPAFVVIVVTLVLVRVFLPSTLWRGNAHDATASMLYYQNWHLIGDAVDYLGGETARSPFQHFWSLSVEEQYYIAWPVLIGLAIVFCRRRGSTRQIVGVLAVGFVVASFVYGLTASYTSPAVAYFSTFARAWELGIGSVLACVAPIASKWLRPHERGRSFALWVSLGALAASFVLIDSDDVFPGWVATVPTVATALIILVEAPEKARLTGLFSARPVQFIGDVSYALYLWHWPLIVVTPFVLSHGPSWWEKCGVIAVSVALAWVSTTFIEAPLRRNRLLERRTRYSFVLAAGLSLVVVAASVIVVLQTDQMERKTATDVVAQIAKSPDCFGAAAMDPGNKCPAHQPLVTSPVYAKSDMSPVITDCLNWPPFESFQSCTYGTQSRPIKRIALFGNSHAGHWLPAFEALATARGWQIQTFVIGVCQPVDDVVKFADGMAGMSAGELANKCKKVVDNALNEIEKGHFDLVVMSDLDRKPQASVEDYAKTMAALATPSRRLMVIRDTPAPLDPKNEPPDCVATNPDNYDDACAGTRSAWIGYDPLADAAKKLDSPNVTTVDLNQYLCGPVRCPAVIGGVIVYADYNHMSTTFARTLAPYLLPYVEPLLIRK